MSKSIIMIDQTNKRVVEVIKFINEEWVKVKDILTDEIYLQEEYLLKKDTLSQ